METEQEKFYRLQNEKLANEEKEKAASQSCFLWFLAFVFIGIPAFFLVLGLIGYLLTP